MSDQRAETAGERWMRRIMTAVAVASFLAAAVLACQSVVMLAANPAQWRPAVVALVSVIVMFLIAWAWPKRR